MNEGPQDRAAGAEDPSPAPEPAEVEAEPSPPTPKRNRVVRPARAGRTRGLEPWARKGVLATIGLAIAALTYAMTGLGIDPDTTVGFGMVLALLVACWLVASRRRERSILGFASDLAALWVGLTLVWMIVDAEEAGGVLAAMSLIGAVAAVAGGVLVSLRLPRREHDE